MTIEQYKHAPDYITFFGGVYVPVEKAEYSLTKISRLQKQLRQMLYNYLCGNGLDSDNYILKIDAPVKPTKEKVYLEVGMTFKPLKTDDLASFEGLCEMFMGEIEEGVNQITPS
ncbi:hypothetical protein E0W68_02255 [Flavobacterium salilacus subsp. salilacus]|nr:hypothetical protein [Flavobacterium salilacus]KAF2520065.1 hypothetical protein E0W68_02255 [Flavobacterium salilacus subsp. salilacus]